LQLEFFRGRVNQGYPAFSPDYSDNVGSKLEGVKEIGHDKSSKSGQF